MNYFSLLQDKRMFSSLRLVKEIPILVFFLKCVSVYFFRYFYVCVGVCVCVGGGGFDKGGIRRTRSNQRDDFFFFCIVFLQMIVVWGKILSPKS